MANERSPLLQNPINEGDIEANLPNRAPRTACLPSVGRFFNNHRRALNVAADCTATLSPFQLANNMLQGWPETYNNNLNTLNAVFAVYFAIQLMASIKFHHSHQDDKKAPLPIAIGTLLLFTVAMMSYITDSLQDNIIAGEAQITNPEGGANSVSPTTFWSIDFAIPVVIALAYSASQFGKSTHQLLTERGSDPLQRVHSRIPDAIKTAFKVTDKVATFGVESVAVFGSLVQDLTYYSISYAGINLLNYPQYATTAIYGGGVALGVTLSALYEAGIADKLITKQTMEKIVLTAGGALGLSVFYTSNIADTVQNGINPSTMTTMIGLPVLMMAAGLVYAVNHNVCKKKNEQAAVIQPVVLPPTPANVVIPAHLHLFGVKETTPSINRPRTLSL